MTQTPTNTDALNCAGFFNHQALFYSRGFSMCRHMSIALISLLTLVEAHAGDIVLSPAQKDYARCAAVFGVISQKASKKEIKEGYGARALLVLAEGAGNPEVEKPTEELRKQTIGKASEAMADEIVSIQKELTSLTPDSIERKQYVDAFTLEIERCNGVYKTIASQIK
jgi:hypothetical protein